ncbi:unnamed protein product [Macrosiphum euphorbiae]|uniref:Uncharacterized protein n=1 Tax=Macrosiphum euphorbiae TaxID=13131 RepID=A0AAV0VIC4_9HEMI|nr:unnamed protein product [Macrosiphum euphorbiae]
MYTHDRRVEAGAAWLVFSYCQVYKYRRFRTVRQNTSGWRGVAGSGNGLGWRSGVCAEQKWAEKSFVRGAGGGGEGGRRRSRWNNLVAAGRRRCWGYRDVAAAECVTADIN